MFHVKHITPTDVERAAAQVALDLNQEQAEKIAAHAQWVIVANQTLNLTAITESADVLRLHVADSLTAVAEYSSAPQGTAIDVGTGGGFPGFPLAVATGRQTVLLDSIGKKSAALSDFVARVGDPGISVSCARAEEHALKHPNAYAVVVARALAELPSLLELAAPLLMPGGWLISMKGRISEPELSRAEQAAPVLGMELESVRRLTLPSGESRSVIVYVKTSEPSLNLPRRPGRAQKRPLA